MDVGANPGDFPGYSALCLVVQSWPSGDYHSAMFYIHAFYILLPYFVNHISMYFFKNMIQTPLCLNKNKVHVYTCNKLSNAFNSVCLLWSLLKPGEN